MTKNFEQIYSIVVIDPVIDPVMVLQSQPNGVVLTGVYNIRNIQDVYEYKQRNDQR